MLFRSGLRTVKELRGEPCIPLELAPRPRKNITVSRSFGKAVSTIDEVQEAVRFYATRACEKLRRSKLAAGVMTVFLMTDRFSVGPQYSNAATVEFANPTDITLDIIERAKQGIASIFKEGYNYRRAGIVLTELKPINQLSLHLFDEDLWIKRVRLTKTIDQINTRWGKDTVRYGMNKTKGNWQTRFTKRSPRYTTNLLELFTVKAT